MAGTNRSIFLLGGTPRPPLSIAQAALSRADVRPADRKISYLYADEFQSFATESFSLILSEARKYGLTLTVAHQYLDQLPEGLRSAVFGNVGSLIACRAGAPDVEILAAQIGLDGVDALLDLPNFAARSRLLRRGVPTSPLRLNLFPTPETRRSSPDRLVRASRNRFGRQRADVERRIAEFLAA